MRRSRVSRTRLLRPSKEIQRDLPDRGFQWLLDSPTCLHTVMRLTRPELLPLVDFSRAERRSRLLVPADLSKLENGALYSPLPLRRPPQQSCTRSALPWPGPSASRR